MKSVLEEIYNDLSENGNPLKNNDEYKKSQQQSADLYIELDDTLTEKQKDLLLKLWHTDAEMEYIAGQSYFKEGFKMCMLILAECLQK